MGFWSNKSIYIKYTSQESLLRVVIIIYISKMKSWENFKSCLTNLLNVHFNPNPCNPIQDTGDSITMFKIGYFYRVPYN